MNLCLECKLDYDIVMVSSCYMVALLLWKEGDKVASNSNKCLSVKWGSGIY